jgi:hypothetical protein
MFDDIEARMRSREGILGSSSFYSRERVAAIYSTSSLDSLLEHKKFLHDFIDTHEKQAIAEWNTERDSGVVLATYAAMCLHLTEQELARRGARPPNS